jgi:cytochrome b561
MGHYNGQKSLNLRVWHWLNAIAIFGLVFTTLFRKTWFNRGENMAFFKEKLLEFGFTLSDEQATILIKTIMEKMWVWHYIFGFMLVALIVFRIFAFVIKSEKCPLQKLKDAPNIEVKGVKVLHIIFYFITLFVAISGVVMFFKEDLGIAKESLSLVKTLHKYTLWFFIAFTVLHIIGAVKAEVTTDKGLISEMFHK